MKNRQNSQGVLVLADVSTDLKLMRSISAHRRQGEQRVPRDVSELSALLKMKKKNLSKIKSISEIESDRSWLLTKGIDIQSLIGKITDLNKKAKLTKAGQAEKSYFHINLSQQPTNEYLKKAEQYASMTLMQSIMSKAIPRKNQTFKLMQRLLEEGVAYSSYSRESTQQQRDSYIAITKEILKNQSQAQSISKALLQQFKVKFTNAQRNSLWEILDYQLAAYDKTQKPPTNIMRMLVTSLKLVQGEFQRRLHAKDFERYVSSEYVPKIESKYVERQEVLLWPKIWVAYCAGETNKVLDLLASDKRDQRQISQLYQYTLKEIYSGRPSRHSHSPKYQIQDIFYDQFIFCVTGQPLFAATSLAEHFSLQLVFITIRTLGIFYQIDSRKFQEIRANIVAKYRDIGPNQQMVRNMLYLLDYSTIVKMGANTLLSKQDYLHFLIVLSGFPGLVSDSSFKPVFTKTLVSFITELINKGKKQYLYYIQLLPADIQADYTSAIVLSVDGLDTFDWKGLKTLMKVQKFNKIVVATTEKYKRRHGTQLKAATMLVDLCEDYEKACDFLLSLCINYHLKLKKHSKDDAIKAQTSGLSWSSQDRQLSAYQMCFLLISSFRELLALIIKRDQQRLRQFIGSCEFVNMCLTEFQSDYRKMFQILQRNNGLQLYYHFLRLIVKGAEIYAVTQGDNENIYATKRIFRQQLKQILNLWFMRNQYEGQHLKNLKQELKDFVLNSQ